MTASPIFAKRLTGVQKTAVLCLALGPEEAARILRHLSAEEVKAVTDEMASLQEVGPDIASAVVAEYKELARADESLARGGVEEARRVLEHAVGPEQAEGYLVRLQGKGGVPSLKQLTRAAPELLHSLLRGEHPQTVALVLAHLSPDQAASVIESLEPALATDVLLRVAQMEKVSPEILDLVENVLSGKTDLSLSQAYSVSGGAAAVANLLNRTSGLLEKALLESLAERDQEVATEIKNLMFVFEDLLLLEGRAVQRLLRDVENKDLALALKAASDELKSHILKNMSERAGSALEEEMEYLGPVRVKDVEAAQVRIIAKARALEESGEIVIPGRGGDSDFIT